MAQEIESTLVVTLSNGYLVDSFKPGKTLIDQSVKQVFSDTWLVGTSEEDLVTGDLATLGYAMFRNLDTTNYVQIGPKSGGNMIAMIRLKPGEPHVMRLEPGITIRGKANTGACKVQVKIFND